MAKKEALRELQSRLAERLQAARTQQRGSSWLAVECSGRGILFPLREAGEIFAMSVLVPVPHTHRWFLGVANLRGLAARMEAELKVRFWVAEDPLTCVVRGAGLILDDIENLTPFLVRLERGSTSLSPVRR